MHLAEVLKLRQQLAKSSVKKYTAMENAVCADSRTRYVSILRSKQNSALQEGLFNYRTCRKPYAGFKRGTSIVKSVIMKLEMLYEDIPDTLSQLIRTAFVPKDGNKFIVADFSAIEARVLSWLAGEEWRTGVFASGGDIYCASASQMFKVPVEKHGVNGHLRQKGKIAELALGYGGSVGALKAMGALEMGLEEEELKPL